MRVNLGISFGFASWLRIVQVAAIPFVFISVTTAAYFGIPRELNNQVAGLINFARNIGGSILISLTNAFVTESTAFHQANFLHSVNSGNAVYQQRLQATANALSPHLGPANAQAGAALRFIRSCRRRRRHRPMWMCTMRLPQLPPSWCCCHSCSTRTIPRAGGTSEIAVH